MTRKTLATVQELTPILTRLAASMMAASPGVPVALIGIRSRGVPLVARLKNLWSQKDPLLTGSLDITLYRDDLSLVAENPVIKATEIDFPIDGKRIWLVDDVLYTGRTIRAALAALMDLGRPEWVKLAVLVDRGGRQLPIGPDVVGITCEAGDSQIVSVGLKEMDGEDGIWIEDRHHG